MEQTLTQADIDAGIARAHKMRSLAFFAALEALTSPLKSNKIRPHTGTVRPA